MHLEYRPVSILEKTFYTYFFHLDDCVLQDSPITGIVEFVSDQMAILTYKISSLCIL